MAIDIRITGTANMGGVAKELQRVQAQTRAMTAQFAQANQALGRTKGPEAQIHNYRQWNAAMGQTRDDMISLTRANGEFQTSSMKVSKHVDTLTERIQKQQMGFREARREAKALGDVYRHQLALQQSTAVSWGQTMAGSQHVDLFTPNLSKQMAGIDNARKKLGFYGQVLSSVSKQTVNWGKNTQWGGRQLMAGFTYPLVIAAGAMGKAAYDIDKGLTQIVKVYGDAGSAMQATDEQIKSAAINTAKHLTQYGQSATETLEIQSQLASTGKTGQELQDATEQVSKARLLGELNIQDAMQATINLQEVYRMDSEKLGETFNYMNQMENETSLTMQDFVEGIPKVSGIMKTLGADVQDAGIMLAAMKTAGIDAKEGGNAVKSMVFKDIAPSAKALKVFSERTNESLEAIVDRTGGDPIATLQGIGEAMDGLPPAEKVQIIKEVFGIHQGSKALGMIDALTEKTGQMGKAFEIAEKGATAWGETAERELRSLKEADWVKLKAAFEDAKLALSEFGKVVLAEAAPALEWIAGMLEKAGDWFSGLGDGSKKVIILTALIAAMAGPAIMMVGLFANLAGHALALGSGLMKLVGNMNLYTTKQKITQLANQRSAKSVDNLSSANMRLANSFDVLTKKSYSNLNPGVASKASIDSIARQNAAKTGSAVGAGSMALATHGVGGPSRGPAGIVITKATVENSSKVASNAQQTRRSWSDISGKMQGTAMAAGFMGTMATDSGSTANNISNMLLTAALIGPMLQPMGGIVRNAFTGSKTVGAISKFGAGVKNALVSNFAASFLMFDRKVIQSAKKAKTQLGTAMATGGVAGAPTGGAAKGSTAKGALAATGGMLAASKGPLAIAAAAVAAYYYAFYKGTKEAKERQDALNNSVKTLGDHLGYATSELEKFKAGSDKNTSLQYQELANSYKEENKKFAEGVKEMSSSQRSVANAIEQGIAKGEEGMIKYGWSKEEAMEYARVYATAINKEVSYGINKKITVHPFVEIGDVKVNQINKIGTAIDDALQANKNSIDGSISQHGWFKRDNSGTVDDPQGGYVSPENESKLTGAGKAEIKKNTKAAWEVFSRTQGEERKKAYQDIGKNLYSGLDDIYAGLSDKQKKLLEKEGVVDSHTLAKYAEENGPSAVVDYLKENGAALSSGDASKLSQAFQVLNEFIIQFLMKARGKTRKEIEAIYGDDLFDVDKLLGTEGFKGSGKGLDKSLAFRSNKMDEFTKQMKLAKQARSALTSEEKKASLEAYKKEYGDINGLIKWNMEMARAEGGTKKLNKAEELARLNKERLAMGLEETGTIQDGFSKKVTVSADAVDKETGKLKKNTDAQNKNNQAKKGAPSWKKVSDIMAGGADQGYTFNNPDQEEAEMAASKYKEIWENVTDEMFEEVSSDLESAHEGVMAGIERDHEARTKRLDAQQERKEAEFDARQQKIEKAFEIKERQFDAKWDKTMENFDSRWDRTMEGFDNKWDTKAEKFDARWSKTMENFDTKWDNKNEKFDAKWDKTMDNFEKSSERAKKAVEKTYDARIKKIEDAIEAEQKAEETRQRIFEKEKARIQYLADMANRSIDINMAINSGDLDEAAKLSNDAQAATDTYEIGDASESSQSASDKKIEGLEERRERVERSKDLAIQRIERRMEAERKALEEQRKIAKKAMEVAQNKERKILEAQQTRQRKAMDAQRELERKSLESQREQQRKSLESQRASEQRKLQSQREATLKRLERERKIYSKEIQAARESNDKITERKKDAEQRRYELARNSLEKEMRALKAFTPRNRKELKEHIEKLEKSYGKYGYRLKKRGGEWSQSINKSLTYWMRVAANEMSGDKRWDKMGKSIANRMTKGAFNKDINQFMKWVEGGADSGGWASSASSSGSGSKKKKKGRIAGTDSVGGMTRHKGGIIDGSRGSRAGYSGRNLSQSEVNVTALKGESVLNRRATSTLGKSGVDALNKGAIPKGHDSRARAIHDDVTKQRGDAPVGIAGVAGLMASKMAQITIGKAIKDKGEEKQAEEQAMMDDWSSGSFGGSQLQNAATIANVGRSLGASPRDIVIALMTAIVESGLKNVPYGDRDSLGLFQQRAAWGSAAARMNPAKSARMFFLGGAQGQEGLFDKKNRSSRGLGELAQAVQVSAFPERYARQEGAARAILKSLKWGKGGFSPPSSLSYGGRTFGGGTDVPGGGGGNVWPGMGFRKMFAIVKRRFPTRAYPDPGQLNQGGHSRGSYHYKGRAVDLGSAKDPSVPLGTLFNWLYRTYGRQSTQIIYGPAASRNILNGKHFNYGSATNAAHMGHIHWAMKNGGIVPGSGSGDRTPILGEPGEFMIRKKAVDNVGLDYLKMLNSDRFINLPQTAASGVSQASTGQQQSSNTYAPVYKVNVDARGAENPQDIQRAVEQALTNIERRKGFDRKIGNK